MYHIKITNPKAKIIHIGVRYCFYTLIYVIHWPYHMARVTPRKYEMHVAILLVEGKLS